MNRHFPKWRSCQRGRTLNRHDISGLKPKRRTCRRSGNEVILEPPEKEGSAVMRVFIGIGLGITLFSIPQTHAEPLPLVCELTSEEVAAIKVLLTERTYVSLKGVLVQDGKTLGTFQTGQSNGYGSIWWSFEDGTNRKSGTSVLFKDDQHWNPHRRIPRPSETNRVLFVGFAPALWYWGNPSTPGYYRENRDLIKSSAGFWSISDQCLGGRIVRG